MTRARKSLPTKSSAPPVSIPKRTPKGKVLLGAVEGGITGAGIGGAAASVVPGVGTVFGGIVGGTVGTVAGARNAQAGVEHREAARVTSAPKTSTPPVYAPSIPIRSADAETGVVKDTTGREF